MVAALAVERTHRVLEIGAGTGYATAILSHLAADIIALERYQSLAIAAQARLAALGIDNAAVVWGNGLALPVALEPFDRIIAHGVLDPVPEAIAGHLTEGGVLVCARSTVAGPAIVRLVKSSDGAAFAETPLGACALTPLLPGLAATR